MFVYLCLMQITLVKLPKVSLNDWYSSKHWTKRSDMKNAYKLIVKNQFKQVLSKNKQYIVNYSFYFIKSPLDASNCVAMVKLIEDIIFEDDKYNIVIGLGISSNKVKGEHDFVNIDITEITS